jgi:hypothetical protein
MASDPVFWGRAGLGWSREGYIARFPLWVEERALYECEDELRQAIADALEAHETVTVGLKPMVVTRTESSSNAEPGQLEIVTQEMIEPAEAVAMKRTVTPLLASAMEATDRLIEDDNKAAEAFREALRQPEAD